MANLDYSRLPEHMRNGMQLYIECGIEPGGFMMAVLSNNLKEACDRADHINQVRLFDIVRWLFNEAPSTCWGSPEVVSKWINSRGESQ